MTWAAWKGVVSTELCVACPDHTHSSTHLARERYTLFASALFDLRVDDLNSDEEQRSESA